MSERGRDREKEPVRVRRRGTSNQGVFFFFPPLSPTWAPSSLQDPMITGQLSKPLLSLRSDMSAAELRAEDKAATPDSDLNDEPLLLSSEATDREGTPNKLYGKCAHTSQSTTPVPSPLPSHGWLRLGEAAGSSCPGRCRNRASGAGTGVSCVRCQT